MMKFYVPIISLMCLTACSLNVRNEAVSYHSMQAQKELVEFAPGVISTQDKFEINTVFNQAGDKLIFARCRKDFSKCTMLESRYANGAWSEGTVLPFSGDYLEADPYYNEDYSALYFISKRPITEGGEATKSLNLWRVAVLGDGWGEPEYLAELSSDSEDLYPSLTNTGDLYFPSFRNEQRLLYVAKKSGSGFEEPTPIPASVYGAEASIGDSAVSRDGRTIVFSISGRADSKGRGDLYVSHLQDGKWTVAKSLGDIVNSSDHEFTPIMSPDGEYLFFTRIENGLGNLYQVHKSLLNW